MREIKVVSHHGGWLSHYFHFLIDFVHPFHSWYAAAGLAETRAPLTVHLKIESEKDPLHEMCWRFAQMYPQVRIVEVAASDFDRLPGEPVELLGWKARGLTHDPKRVEAFALYHSQDPEVRVPTGKDVLLIERGFEQKTTGRNNGHAKRSITNSVSLESALRRKFAERFECVVLENLEMREQIRLFRHASVIVGVHGAAFSNVIFCRQPRASMIEVHHLPRGEKLHFATLASAAGVGYHHVHVKAKRSSVRVAPLVRMVRDCVGPTGLPGPRRATSRSPQSNAPVPEAAAGNRVAAVE